MLSEKTPSREIKLIKKVANRAKSKFDMSCILTEMGSLTNLTIQI